MNEALESVEKWPVTLGNPEMNLLAPIAEQLLAARDPDEIIRAAFKHLSSVLPLDGYFNFMVNNKGDALELASCAGIPPEEIKSCQNLQFGEAVCGTVAATRRAMTVFDVQESKDSKVGLVKGLGFKSYACNPLEVDGKLLGTLSFASRRVDKFSKTDIAFLTTLTRFIALAIDRRKKELDVRKRTESLARLHSAFTNISRSALVQGSDVRSALQEIARQITAATDISGVSIWRKGQSCDKFHMEVTFSARGKHTLPIREIGEKCFHDLIAELNVLDVIVASGEENPPRSELVDAFLRPLDLTSALIAPIMIGGRVEGFLSLERDPSEPDWTPSERTFAVSVANTIALVWTQAAHNLALREVEQRQMMLRMASRVGKLGGWEVQLPGMSLKWSEEVRQFHEVSDGFEPTVENAINFYRPEFRERIRAAFSACTSEGTPYDLELQLQTAKGRNLWVRAIGEAERNEEGNIIGVHGAFQDISEKKKAEEQVRENAFRLQTVLESITEAFFTLNRNFEFTFVNSEAERLLQRTRSELLGRSIWAEFPQAIGTVFQREYERAFSTNETAVFEEFYEPLQRWFEVRAYPSADSLAVYFRDVTEQRISREKLREQAALLDNARDAILVISRDRRILYWNRSAERLYGWAAAEVLGRNVEPLLYPEKASVPTAAFSITLEQGAWVGELRQRTREGREVIIEGHWTLMRDDSGQPKSILKINRDISERKKLEEQFFRAQRLEGIGTLAGGIAHDLNNVLSPILIATEILKSEVSTDEAQSFLDLVRSSAERGADLVKQVLSFARGIQGRRVSVNPKHILHEIQKIIKNTFPKNIHFALIFRVQHCTIAGDPTQLHQVFLNLCVNARDAMPDGGTIQITVDNFTVDELFANLMGEVQPGRYILFSIADSGSGIPRNIRDKIFDPFFTTKEVGHGTGLGLSTVLGIVKSHGGFIQVESEEGKGATFKVYLPADQRSGDTSVSDKAECRGGNGELILIVDDDKSNQCALGKALQRYGYNVTLANNGAEAVSVYAQRHKDIAAVILNVAMPIMDGRAAAVALRSIDPKVRIIGSSGFAITKDSRENDERVYDMFISKPYSVDLLLSALTEILATSPNDATDTTMCISTRSAYESSTDLGRK